MLKHLLVGAVSGGVSRTVVAPLERAKIEYMLDSTTIARDGGLVGTLRRIIRNEGPGGLFRGNTLNVLRIAPTKAVEFFVYDKIKDHMISTGDQTELDGLQRMLGGSIASMCGTALTHPVDTLRSRVSGTGMLLGDCWKQLVANEGYGALWKGLGANMVRVAPYGAINFYVYDACKSMYRRQFGEKAKMSAVADDVFRRSRRRGGADGGVSSRDDTASNSSRGHEERGDARVQEYVPRNLRHGQKRRHRRAARGIASQLREDFTLRRHFLLRVRADETNVRHRQMTDTTSYLLCDMRSSTTPETGARVVPFDP